jgi:hypothetical protein
MLAYQLVEWQQPPVLRDVPVPDPGPEQVRRPSARAARRARSPGRGRLPTLA